MVLDLLYVPYVALLFYSLPFVLHFHGQLLLTYFHLFSSTNFTTFSYTLINSFYSFYRCY